MKNHKGAIATLLTLGLVLVGTLITLGTSLFVNNKKNIASNPRAANRSCVAPLVEINAKAASCSQLCGANYSGPTWTENGEYHCCCKSGSGSTNPPPSSGGTTGDVCKTAGGTCKRNTSCTQTVTTNRANAVAYCNDNFDPNYTCCKNNSAASTQPPATGDGDYPEDDSCWIVKCLEGKANKVKYAGSLKKNSMPLTSCQGGSPYSGGGKMIIGIVDSDAYMKTFTCENGNEEITLAPIEAPIKTCNYNSKTYGQGDNFCGVGAAQNKDLMWCDNGVAKKSKTCASGCKDGNCVADGGGFKKCPPNLNCQGNSDATYSLKCFPGTDPTAGWYCDPRPVFDGFIISNNRCSPKQCHSGLAEGCFNDYKACVAKLVEKPCVASNNYGCDSSLTCTGDGGKQLKCGTCNRSTSDNLTYRCTGCHSYGVGLNLREDCIPTTFSTNCERPSIECNPAFTNGVKNKYYSDNRALFPKHYLGQNCGGESKSWTEVKSYCTSTNAGSNPPADQGTGVVQSDITSNTIGDSETTCFLIALTLGSPILSIVCAVL